MTVTDSDESFDTLTRTDHITVFVELTVNKTGSGSGTVTSSSPGIDCGSDCTETYNDEVSVTLTATPDSGDYYFSGWSGDDCSGTGDCIITIDASKSVTAEFDLCPYDPVRITGSLPSYYSILQDAYALAENGDIIQSRDSVFVEDPIFNKPVIATLEGGYNCDYSTVTGVTTVQGSITINNGEVIINKYAIEVN